MVRKDAIFLGKLYLYFPPHAANASAYSEACNRPIAGVGATIAVGSVGYIAYQLRK